LHLLQIRQTRRRGCLVSDTDTAYGLRDRHSHKSREALIFDYAEAIRKLGREHCIISEELNDHPGVDPSPEQHVDGLGAFIAALG
jgi:hypothetical protein